MKKKKLGNSKISPFNKKIKPMKLKMEWNHNMDSSQKDPSQQGTGIGKLKESALIFEQNTCSEFELEML